MEHSGTTVLAIAAAIGFVWIGELITILVPGLRKVFLPGAVMGGLLALAIGPQVFPVLDSVERLTSVYEILGQFPGLFINVVFACLMLGKPIARLSKIWERARRQVLMGHIYAWGQYVVGLSLALAVLGPMLSLDALVGTSIAIGFQGGHGTAAGLSSTFQDLGFADGKTIAYAVATFGVLAGAIGGPLLGTYLTHQADTSDKEKRPKSEKPGGGDHGDDHDRQDSQIEFSPLTGKLTIHFALVGIVIAMGWGALQGLQALEWLLRSDGPETLYTKYIPLFSVVLIVGFLIQVVLQSVGLGKLFKRPQIDLISAFALDMVIVSALATLALETVGEYWIAILVLCAGGLAWNLAVFFVLGKRVYPKPWYPYALGDLGGGTATTASGLLLIRVADPDNQTQAKKAYSEKQPFYEPLMGGGLVTAMALPIVSNLGAGITLGITGGILAALIGTAVWLCRR